MRPPCVECDREAELGVLGSISGVRTVLYYCIACAKEVSARLSAPTLAAAALDAEKRKAARS